MIETKKQLGQGRVYSQQSFHGGKNLPKDEVRMTDSQKWLEAAAGIEQDLEYLNSALSEEDLEHLRLALTLYRTNAAFNVPWPSPDDLYCIQPLAAGAQQRITVETRPRLAI